MADSISVVAPYDETLIQELPLHTAEDVDAMLEQARKAFLNRDKWLTRLQRVEILSRILELMQRHEDELIEIATREGGKPVTDTAVEVARAIQGVQVAIHSLYGLGGTEVPMGLTSSALNRAAFTRREPIGVVAAISAFNHPINLVIHQTITAIAAGCPVIVKPALTTPLSCIRLMELYREAGLDEVWCRAAIADNDVAEMLATDPRVS